MSERKKRKRNARPAHPPTAPSSLVKLLQKDKAVFTYFQSLQANLQADVEIHKRRAAEYKKKCQDLEKQLNSNKTKKEEKKKVKRHDQKSSSSSSQQQQGESTVEEVKKPAPVSRRAAVASGTDNDPVVDPKGESITNDGDKEWDLFMEDDSEEDQEVATEDQGTVKSRPHEIEKLHHLPDIESCSDDESQDMDVDLSEYSSANEGSGPEDSRLDRSSTTGRKFRKVGKRTPKQQNASLLDVYSCSATDDDDVDVREESDDDKRTADEGLQSRDAAEAFALLQEVYQSWTQMGVRFVTSNQDRDEPKSNEFGGLEGLAPTWLADRQSEDEDEVGLLQSGAVRASDEDVVADLLHAMKSAVRPPAQEGEDSSIAKTLFPTAYLIPCCNLPDEVEQVGHLATKVKRNILRGLVILDTLCSESVSNATWNSYFQGLEIEEVRSMKVGLRCRKAMVMDLIRSFDREICEVWPCADRFDHRNTAALHLDASNNATPRESMSLSKGMKSQPRLSILLDRCMIAQIVVGFYLAATDRHRPAHLVLDYILSSVASKGVEDYPKLPPTLSMVVLEGLLLPERDMLWWIDEEANWFAEYCSETIKSAKLRDSILRQLTIAVKYTASIWEQRKGGSDSRIHDIALVEHASYERLLVSATLHCAANDQKFVAQSPSELLALWANGESGKFERRDWVLSISMTMTGNLEEVRRQTHEACALDSCGDESSVDATCLRLIASSKAVRQMELRLLPSSLHKMGRSQETAPRLLSFAGAVEALLVGDSPYSCDQACQVISTSLECSWDHGDGECAVRTMQVLVQKQGLTESASFFRKKQLLDTICAIVQTPVVRVVNLKRRYDRLNAFLAQALRERIMVIKAVATTPESNPNLRHDDFGGYAFDGSGRLAEAHERLIGVFGSVGQLEKLVNTQWCPNDLRPFDRDAPNHQRLVRMTPSEQACALSHIYSWKGVMRSLQVLPPLQHSSVGPLRFPDHLVRLSKLSGFAEGPAFLPENQGMPPCPACVILEDDAILVDGFAERLQALLKELPRDFHYCSLGYSRPKTAPICPYSSLVGIPTMQWYLTGYLLSEAGASSLLDSLPVQGPVDSWIGLRMMSMNWDNSFGINLGVGIAHNSTRQIMPSLKDLRQIIHFRAFCALQPLCSQRVTGTTQSSARSWRRQRDTDIDYSGGSATTSITS